MGTLGMDMGMGWGHEGVREKNGDIRNSDGDIRDRNGH